MIGAVAPPFLIKRSDR